MWLLSFSCFVLPTWGINPVIKTALGSSGEQSTLPVSKFFEPSRSTSDLLTRFQVCGPFGPQDFGFGDGDRTAAVINGQEIEYIAVSLYDGAKLYEQISGIEIMYRGTPAPFVHGTMTAIRREMRLNIDKKEHVTGVRIDCTGPPSGQKFISYILITTGTINGLVAGTPSTNPKEINNFRVDGKKVSTFFGYTNSRGYLKSIGMIWTNVNYGQWPENGGTIKPPGGGH